MRFWQVRHKDGHVLHEGSNNTQRGFLQALVSQGASMAGADLSGHNLSGMDFSPKVMGTGRKRTRVVANFQGAVLDGADCRGTNFTEASMQGMSACTLPPIKDGMPERPARFDGAKAELTVFDGSILDGADMSGLRGNHSSFTGCSINGTGFDGAALTGANLTHVKGSRASFGDAVMVNADLSMSYLVEPDFRGTDVTHRAFGNEDRNEYATSLLAHLPNRTRGAVIVAGDYNTSTRLSDTVPRLIGDARAGRITRGVLACSATAALVLGVQCAEPWAEAAGHFFGVQHFEGMGYIGVVGAAHFCKETASMWAHEHASEALGKTINAIRRAYKKVERSTTRRVDLVCAMTRKASFSPLMMALAARAPEARARGLWGKARVFASDLGNVVLCERKHLSLALATLSTYAASGIRLNADITVVRCDGKHADGNAAGPCAMRFRKDGQSSSVWHLDGRHVTVQYGRDGQPTGWFSHTGIPLPPEEVGNLPLEAGARLDAAIMMEGALLSGHGLGNFTYPRETHALGHGRDGTILVQRRSNKQVDNPATGQPALILPCGTTVRVRAGRPVAPALDHEETPVEDVRAFA